MKLNISKIKNGDIKARTIELKNDKDYIEIPLMDDDKKYKDYQNGI